MFSPRNILHIKDFDFEREGVESKDKFMIVILQTSEDLIIAPLTTSVDHIPEIHKGKRCVYDVPSRLHCYCMPKTHTVGKNGYAFRKDTYIQVQGNLTKRSITHLKEKYYENGAVSLLDELTDNEYSDLLYCIYKSQFVPRGIRNMMEPIIQGLEGKKAS